VSVCVVSACVVRSVCVVSVWVVSVRVLNVFLVSVYVVSVCVVNLSGVSVWVVNVCIVNVCVLSVCVANVCVVSVCACGECVHGECVRDRHHGLGQQYVMGDPQHLHYVRRHRHHLGLQYPIRWPRLNQAASLLGSFHFLVIAFAVVSTRRRLHLRHILRHSVFREKENGWEWRSGCGCSSASTNSAATTGCCECSDSRRCGGWSSVDSILLQSILLQPPVLVVGRHRCRRCCSGEVFRESAECSWRSKQPTHTRENHDRCTRTHSVVDTHPQAHTHTHTHTHTRTRERTHTHETHTQTQRVGE